MNDKELSSLVEDAKRGDAEAFAKIYTRYAQSIYYLGLKITRNEHDAQDIVQDTMYKVYNSLHTLKNAKKFGAFINRTAYNTCISFVRDRMEITADDDSFFLTQKESNIDLLPEERFDSQEMQKKIIDAIDDLGDSHRTVILLFYYEKLSIKQIANLLEISQQAVKNRLFRAKENMKKKIADSSSKGVVIFAVLFPAITKALTIEANASFSPAVHQEIWMQLGKRIGLSALETSSTLPIVATKSMALPLSEITGSQLVGPHMGSGSKLVVGILAAGIVAGGGYIYQVNQPVKQVEAPYRPTEHYNAISSQDIVPVSDIDSSVSPPNVTEENPPEAEEAPLASSPASTMPEEETVVENLKPTVWMANKMPLRYAVGTLVTPEQLVADAQIIITDGAKLEFYGLEEVDFLKAGDYGIYLQATDESGAKSDLSAIIIHMY